MWTGPNEAQIPPKSMNYETFGEENVEKKNVRERFGMGAWKTGAIFQGLERTPQPAWIWDAETF